MAPHVTPFAHGEKIIMSGCLGACVEHDRPEGGLQIDVNPLVELMMARRSAKAPERGGRHG